jgi:hypothetical protein
MKRREDIDPEKSIRRVKELIEEAENVMKERKNGSRD